MSDHDKHKSSRTYQNDTQDKEVSKGREILELVVMTAVILFVFILLRHFVAMPVKVDGPSMEPTLQDGDRLILNRMTEPERFDVVVFDAPDDSGSQYIKRIIGMPGDMVEYSNGILYVNEQEVYEPYLEEFKLLQPNWQAFVEDFTLSDLTESNIVPEGKYFVLGDNRANSKDGRYFGYIDAEEVSGTANFRFFPFSGFGNVNDVKNFPDIPDQAVPAK